MAKMNKVDKQKASASLKLAARYVINPSRVNMSQCMNNTRLVSKHILKAIEKFRYTYDIEKQKQYSPLVKK